MAPLKKIWIITLLLLLPFVAACSGLALTPTDSAQGTKDALDATLDAALTQSPEVVTEEVLREVTREVEVQVEVTATPEADPPTSTPEPSPTVEGAQLTRLAATLTAIVVSSTPTPEGGATPVPEEGEADVVVQTEEPGRNAGFTPAAQGDQTACDRFAYVADVTFPDGTEVRSGQSITKTWRIQNTGTCTWTTGYKLVFSSGFQLNGPDAVNIPHTVPPGSYVNLTVQLRAPTASGTYRGNWMMFSRSGYNFGGDPDGAMPLWVEVVVPGADTQLPSGQSGFTPVAP